MLGDVKHFCDLTCLLQFCCDNVITPEEILKRKVFLVIRHSCILDIYIFNFDEKAGSYHFLITIIDTFN